MKYAQGSTFSTIVDYGKSVWAYTDDSASYEIIPENTSAGTVTGNLDRTEGTMKFGPFYKPTVVKITAMSGELDVRNYEFSVTPQTDNEFNELMTATGGMTPEEAGRSLVRGYDRSNQMLISSENIHPPTYHGTGVTSGNEISTSSVITKTPAYKINKIVIGWSNWATDFDGSALPEKAGDANMTIEASILVDGVKYSDVTFNGGSLSVSIAPGANAFCDPISVPAWTDKDIEIITTRTVNVGNAHIGGYGVKYDDFFGKYTNGAYYSSLASEHAAIRDGGSISSNASSQYAYVYGPSIMLTDGNDGRGVCVCVGDSVGYGQHPYAHSFVTYPLVNNRIPYINLSVPGTKPTNWDSDTLGEARYKYALLDECAAINNGARAFDVVISELGGNNSSSDDGDLMISRMEAYWQYIRFRFSAPIYQTTFVPAMSSDTTYYGTDLSTNSSLSLTDTERTDRWFASDYFLTLPNLIDAASDIRPIYTQTNGTDWPVFDFSALITAEETSSNAKVIYMDEAPPIGSQLIFRPGGTDPQYLDGWVLDVQPHANGYEVTTNYKIGTTVAVGDEIKITYTRDGVHLAGLYPNDLGGQLIEGEIVRFCK